MVLISDYNVRAEKLIKGLYQLWWHSKMLLLKIFVNLKDAPQKIQATAFAVVEKKSCKGFYHICHDGQDKMYVTSQYYFKTV